MARWKLDTQRSTSPPSHAATGVAGGGSPTVVAPGPGDTTAPPAAAAPTASRGARPWLMAVVVWTVLFVVLLVSLAPILPPRPVPADAPSTAFSAERAMRHLRLIAQQPRPTGSPAAARARDYLRVQLAALGMQAQVQRGMAVDEEQPTHFHAGVVENVVGRLRGTGDGRAVLLAAHYDSPGASPGASDDGVAVAALLEAARALRANGPLRADVIVLFTDGEEFGPLGSKVFMAEHPWAKDVRMVLNFEARGSAGPSIMFQTSAGNGTLIRALGTTSTPVGSPISQAVYHALGNSSDFDVFAAAGLPGMDFAVVGDQINYHNRTDSLANVERASLQHHGDYAVQLTRYFGNRDLEAQPEPDAVYFNLSVLALVRYPLGLAVPFGVTALVALAAAVALGVRRRILSVSRTAAGLGAAVAVSLLAGATSWAMWQLIASLRPGYDLLLNGAGYHSGVYLAAFCVATAALTAEWFRRFRRRLGLEHLIVGVALWWALLLTASLAVLPEAAHLFTWPLVAMAGALFHRIVRPSGSASSGRRMLAFAPAVVLAIVLFGPVLYLLLLAVGPQFAWIGMPLLAGVVTLSVPFLPGSGRASRGVPLAGAVAAVVLLVVAMAVGGFEARQPRPNNFFYALDSDSGTAVWGTVDSRPAEWTRNYAPTARGSRLPTFFRMPYDFRTGPAPTAPLAGPTVRVVSNTVTGGVRTVHLNARSGRGAPILELISTSDARIRAATVEGRRIPNPHRQDPFGYRWSLHFIAPPPAGLDVVLEVESTRPLPLRLLDRSYSIEEVPSLRGLVRRPVGTMPGNEDGDFVAVSSSVVIP